MENDQAQSSGEPVAQADGGTTEETIETEAAQPVGQEGSDALETKNLPPELEEQRKELLRAFHKKTQALSEKEKTLVGDLERYKADAQTLYTIGNEEWFKQAVANEKAKRSGAMRDISDEEFETIKSDKKSFQNFLAQQNKALVESLKGEFKGEFEKLSRSQKEMLAEREFEAVANEYGDEFKSANEDKALDPYRAKGLSYEDAFLLHMQKQGKLAKKPEQTSRQTVATEKGGMPRVRGGPVVKAKDLNEALDRVFDLARKGTKDYRFEK